MIQQSLTRGIIPYSLTSQGGLYFSKYDTYKVAHFNVVTTAGNLTQTIGLSVKSGTHAFVDWGDGSALTDVSYVGLYQNYTHTYASAGTYNARLINLANVTGLKCTTTFITMSITTLTSLTYLYLLNTGTSITGSIAGMALTYLYLNGTSTAVTGALSTSSRLTRFYYTGCDGTLVIPTTGLVFGASMTDIFISGNTTGQPSAVIDTILNAAAATTWAAPKTITASGNNGAHTSASASALTTLAGLGVTVTVN